MHISPQAPQPFIEAIETIESQLDGVVDHGSEEELFVASYLQGHFAVIARQQEMEQHASLSSLDEAIQDSLQQAFAQGELQDDDQLRVQALWQRLFSSL